MPYYITTLILLVISIFLAIITLAVNGKGKGSVNNFSHFGLQTLE